MARGSSVVIRSLHTDVLEEIDGRDLGEAVKEALSSVRQGHGETWDKRINQIQFRLQRRPDLGHNIWELVVLTPDK